MGEHPISEAQHRDADAVAQGLHVEIHCIIFTLYFYMIKKSQNRMELCRAGAEKQDAKGIVSATDYFGYQAVSS